MAEKEERIGIKIEIYDPCGRCTIKDKCAKNIDPQAFLKDPHSCFQYKLLHRSPTKADVIERMAKAICANIDEYADCEQCEFNGPEDCKRYYRSNFIHTAEAVLNALLEGK